MDPRDLVYEGPDPGVDGAIVFLDDRAVFSASELNEILDTSKKEFDVTIVLAQIKTDVKYNKKEIDSFVGSIVDLLSDDPQQPHAQHLAEFRETFLALFKRIGRISNGKPNLHAAFVNTALNTTADEILAAFRAGKRAFEELGLFHEVEFERVWREPLHQLWLNVGGSVEAMLPVVGYAPFPKAPSIDNAYVATVKARNFIDVVLKDREGTVRKKLFEENVRDFLGVDVEVNREIHDTLTNDSKKKRFGLMNNGITIVASVVRVAGTEIYIKDFQVVNGCQTSNVLIEADEYINDDVSLMVKLIQADEQELVDDVVRATNRQSAVEDEQFISTMSYLKELEKYFEVRGKDEPNRLYFERRTGQYGSESIAAMRIFDIREMARCYAATFLMKPELASRYPNRLTGELLHDVFKPGTKEELYYVSCYALYRLKLLIGNKRFDQRYSKLRWHILSAASKFSGHKYNALGASSKEEGIYKLFSDNEGANFDRLNDLILTAIPDPDLSRDLLKSQPLTATTLSNVDALL